MNQAKHFVALSILSVAALSACSPSLETSQIEELIQDDMIKQGALSVKEVTCPDRVKPEANSTFDCSGEVDTGNTFPIVVKLLDEKGTAQWEVPNSQGILNLATLQSTFQEEIAKQTGTKPTIDCGGVYRDSKPGDTFECKVITASASATSTDAKSTTAKSDTSRSTKATNAKGTKAKAVEKPQLESILVSVDLEGNINWQQVLRAPEPKPSPATIATKPTKPQAKPSEETEVSAAPAKPSAPAKSTAEDFLNQVGAADDF